MGASDLHFEPYEKAYRIRFRVDGVLREHTRPPVQLAGKLAARLKVMSQMDISERRLPQDGRIKLKLSKTRAIDFRVNSLPTLFGEKLCLRILDPLVQCWVLTRWVMNLIKKPCLWLHLKNHKACY